MLTQIIKKYFPDYTITEVDAFGNGHINDTYRVKFENREEAYILQRINTNVFTNPDGLVNNHFKIQAWLEKQETELEIPVLFPISGTNKYLVSDPNGSVWRMTNFIRESHSVEVVEHNHQACEAGNAFGWFAKVNATLPSTEFVEAIKDFHRLSFRLHQLHTAIAADKAGRLNEIRDLVEFYTTREEKLMAIERLTDAGKIPVRVVHNDTKINNLLFRGENACAVIDLDTVGPGILYYDYGDAIRTIGNTAAEDEKDLSKVNFNFDAFESFSAAYLNQVKPVLTPEEKSYFHLAPVLMTYIMGIRFLADYLNGDVYYKISFPEQNIVRARVQRKLIECMENIEAKMITSIESTLKA